MAFRASRAGEYPQSWFWGSDEGSGIPVFCCGACLWDVDRDRAYNGGARGVEEEYSGQGETQADLLVHPGGPGDHIGECALALDDGDRPALAIGEDGIG